MKRYLPFIIIAVVAVLTIGSGAMLYHAKQRAAARSSATANSAKSEMPPQHVRGASKAPITLEEFADFQCPACAKTMVEMIRPLEKDYGSRLRVVFWHFPLPNHKHGRDAALAAEAASLQGRFGKCTICFIRTSSSGARRTTRAQCLMIMPVICTWM